MRDLTARTKMLARRKSRVKRIFRRRPVDSKMTPNAEATAPNDLDPRQERGLATHRFPLGSAIPDMSL
jgi:hypothetical protein